MTKEGTMHLLLLELSLFGITLAALGFVIERNGRFNMINSLLFKRHYRLRKVLEEIFNNGVVLLRNDARYEDFVSVLGKDSGSLAKQATQIEAVKASIMAIGGPKGHSRGVNLRFHFSDGTVQECQELHIDNSIRENLAQVKLHLKEYLISIGLVITAISTIVQFLASGRR